jgi:hypothetical protein
MRLKATAANKPKRGKLQGDFSHEHTQTHRWQLEDEW